MLKVNLKNFSFILLLLLATFFTKTIFAAKPGCVFLNSNNNQKNLLTNAQLEFINTFVFQQSAVPALVIGIVSENGTTLVSCGETAVGNGKRPTADTIFPIGSVSKVFTGTIFAEMVKERKVGLVDPVEKYFPANIKIPSFPNRKVTLIDLATHTSGFSRSPEEYSSDDPQNQKSYGKEAAYKWLNTTKLDYEPGSYFLYSNFGLGLLGDALARAGNMTYAQLFKKYINEQLDMKDTTTQDQLTSDQKNREVKSYWLNGELLHKDWPFEYEIPSGGVYSTANDMIKYIKYNLNLPPYTNAFVANKIAHATYVYQNEVADPFAFKYDGLALSWHVEFPHQNLPLMLNKSGWVNGVVSWAVILPTAKLGIFSFSTKPYLNIEADLKNLLGSVLGNQNVKTEAIQKPES